MEICPPETNLFLHNLTSVWLRGGWIGVDIFFVLSGFLVSGLLFNEQQRTGLVRVKNFLIRRGFKIYPSFYFLILISALCPLAHHGSVNGGDSYERYSFCKTTGVVSGITLDRLR